MNDTQRLLLTALLRKHEWSASDYKVQDYGKQIVIQFSLDVGNVALQSCISQFINTVANLQDTYSKVICSLSFDNVENTYFTLNMVVSFDVRIGEV